MEPSTRNNTLRSLLVFVIIGAILLGAVILGVRFARGRSDQIGASATNQTQQQPQTAQTDAQKAEEQRKAAEQKAADDRKKAEAAAAASAQKAKDEQAARDKKAAEDKKTAEDKAKVAATSAAQAQTPVNTNPTPAQVPQTGPGDIVLPIAMLVALAFAATNYLQSRRRLAPLK